MIFLGLLANDTRKKAQLNCGGGPDVHIHFHYKIAAFLKMPCMRVMSCFGGGLHSLGAFLIVILNKFYVGNTVKVGPICLKMTFIHGNYDYTFELKSPG